MYEPPRYEFWRPITPVLGEPIPAGAMFLNDRRVSRSCWQHPAVVTFRKHHLDWRWKVPVEVVPLEVAVDAVYCNAGLNNRYEIAEALRKAARHSEKPPADQEVAHADA
jgi:hypothetical protein